ncbi:MAG: GDSL-type esterase/lipase family protein [Candidatus Neomarinimicrobiota bacterium]
MNGKKISFRVFLLIIPFLFFISLESFLRLFGLFNPQSLFFEKKNNDFIQVNSDIGQRYFDSKKVPVPNMYPQKFSAIKSKSTFRIFCLGGSTTAGFPYEMNVPFPQQLKFILEDNYLEKKIEVINLGLSAINSFTILDWIPQILNHEPDLIIIYMGHNEYYGAYGVGSKISFTNNGFLVRLALSLKNLNTFLMIEKILSFSVSKIGNKSNGTLMEQISKKKEIPVDSKLRRIVYNNFDKNLEIILNDITNNNIPVIISTLTSNLLDQAPFGGNGTEGSESIKSIDFYNKGVVFFANQNYDSSKIYFNKALDLDEIPFRADKNINQIIKKKSNDFKIERLDMIEIFEENSKGRIPGNNLFSDHLHPNPKGYALMAYSIYKKIIHMGLLDGNIITKNNEPNYVTNLDWEIGQQRLFRLKKRWPFKHQIIDYSNYTPYENKITAQIANEFVFKHHIWGKAHEDLAKYYESNMKFLNASKEYEVIIKMFPDKIRYFYKLIENGKKSSLWRVVERTCLNLLKIDPDNAIVRYDLALSQRSLGKLKKSFENVNQSIEYGFLNDNQLAYALFLKALILIDIKEYDDSKKLLIRIKKDYSSLIKVDSILKKLN